MTVVPAQTRLFPSKPRASPVNASVFTPNMSLRVHRWFRYSAGFSSAWVEHVVAEAAHAASPSVLDPFAGSGTSLIGARAARAESIGVESHPFVARVARAKLAAWESADAFEARALAVV